MTASMTGAPASGSNGHSAQTNGHASATAGELIARGVCAWFGSRLVLEDVNLDMERSKVTALIGPSGCGKSTFIRTLNRMHEVVPSAQLAGSVELDGSNIYAPDQRANEVRQHIGMVFQRPNPFPAMSIYDNVLAGLRFTRTKSRDKDALVEESLARAGLWTEVKNRLRDLGGALSGGQQQRLCIARGTRRQAQGPADGRAVFGARPGVDHPYRADHRGDCCRRDGRDRDPQHATGATGLALLCLFLGGREPAGQDRREWPDRR